MAAGTHTEKFALRCSELPQFEVCQHYRDKEPVDLPPDIPIEHYYDATATGNACHEVLARYAVNRTITNDEIAQIAVENNVADGEILRYWKLVRFGMKMVDTHLKDYDWIAERRLSVEFPSFILTGMPDIYTVVDGTVYILDWKTGRKLNFAATRAQLKGYALLLMNVLPELEKATILIVALDSYEYETLTFTRQEIIDWYKEIARKVKHPGAYTIGGHCQYCKIQHRCAALQHNLDSMSKYLTGTDNTPTPSMHDIVSDPKLLDSMLVTAKILEKGVANFKEQLQAYVRDNGPVGMGDGTVYGFKQIQTKTIDTDIAFNLLATEYVGEEKARQAFKPTIGLIDELVKQWASEHGEKKGASVAAFYEKLEEKMADNGLALYDTGWRWGRHRIEGENK